MGYYKGDYYQGDYYQGDPLSLKGVLGGVGKIARGFLERTPIGAAAKTLLPILSGGRPAMPQVIGRDMPAQIPGLGPPPLLQAPAAQQPTMRGFELRGPFGTGVTIGERGFGPPTVAPQIPVMVGPDGKLCMMKGTHANKSTYITRGGGTSRWPRGTLLVHVKGTECVKVRRMNVANPRALRRAIRRAAGFTKLARRVLRFTAPRAAKRFAGFRKRSRKRVA